MGTYVMKQSPGYLTQYKHVCDPDDEMIHQT